MVTSGGDNPVWESSHRGVCLYGTDAGSPLNTLAGFDVSGIAIMSLDFLLYTSSDTTMAGLNFEAPR
jgi:hypothetical protein